MTKRQRVSDLISKDEIMTWQKGDIVTIKAGTGAGKSYFIKNSLYEVAKANNQKILMLIHRRNCVDQFQEEIERDEKTDVIDIRTYQSIEHVERQGEIFDLSHYDYIVSDEWHYFFHESRLGGFTDMSLDAILNSKESIRIFMSATGDKMNRYLTGERHKNLEAKSYEIPNSYNFIEKLRFYKDRDTVESFIEDCIKHKRKSMFFFYSATEAYELHKKYEEHSLFNCSPHNEKYGKYVDTEKIDSMLKNERFESLLIFTTTAMDSGVNIHDDEVKDIFIHGISDIDTLIQCIGRKRLKKNERINLTVKAISNQKLGGIETAERKRADRAAFLYLYGTHAYDKEYSGKNNRNNDSSNIIYTVPVPNTNAVELKVNELMLFKTISNISAISRMKKYKSKNNYCEYLRDLFQLDGYTMYEESIKVDKLERYLDSIVGEVMLQTDDRKELIDLMNVRRDGKLLRSLNSLNSALDESHLDYRIKQFTTSRIIDGKKKNYKSAWKVQRLSDK